MIAGELEEKCTEVSRFALGAIAHQWLVKELAEDIERTIKKYIYARDSWTLQEFTQGQTKNRQGELPCCQAFAKDGLHHSNDCHKFQT